LSRLAEELIVRDVHQHELRFMAHEDYFDAFRNEGMMDKGTHFPCFTGTEVLALLVQKYLTPPQCASRLRRVLTFLALLVQKCKY
jgi:hypothetical protein